MDLVFETLTNALAFGKSVVDWFEQLPQLGQVAIEIAAAVVLTASSTISNPASFLRFLSLRSLRRLFVRRFFIAVPMTALQSDDPNSTQAAYTKVRELVQQVDEEIRKRKRFPLTRVRVYSAVLDQKRGLFRSIDSRENFSDLASSEPSIREAINQIEKADEFFLINVDKRSSSVIFELGIAFARRLPISIFSFQDVGLPILVEDLDKHGKKKRYSHVKIYRLRTIDDVLPTVRGGTSFKMHADYVDASPSWQTENQSYLLER
ncbi:MAG: hypothetical protein GC152_06300 [Alphaproteobacteria bacterium]|nr:hypothetical protein [Alphaproteobacteria bacterium]